MPVPIVRTQRQGTAVKFNRFAVFPPAMQQIAYHEHRLGVVRPQLDGPARRS